MKKLKKIECKSCGKKSVFKLCGFSPNQRYECSNCKAVFIPLKTRIFGKYACSSPWIERTEWISWINSDSEATISQQNSQEIKSIA